MIYQTSIYQIGRYNKTIIKIGCLYLRNIRWQFMRGTFCIRGWNFRKNRGGRWGDRFIFVLDVILQNCIFGGNSAADSWFSCRRCSGLPSGKTLPYSRKVNCLSSLLMIQILSPAVPDASSALSYFLLFSRFRRRFFYRYVFRFTASCTLESADSISVGNPRCSNFRIMLSGYLILDLQYRISSTPSGYPRAGYWRTSSRRCDSICFKGDRLSP